MTLPPFILSRWIALVGALGCVVAPGCGGTSAVTEAPTVHVSQRALIQEAALTKPSPDVLWSCWRGGGHQGVSPATNLPVRWSERQGIAWKVAVPGQGNSSPVVWGENVLLSSVFPRNDGPAKAAILCWNLQTGHEVWSYTCELPLTPSHAKNGLASATLATDGQIVVAAFSGLGLIAVDLAGRFQWQVPLPAIQHEWGLASSPVLFKDLVIHVADGQRESFVAAFDKRTGETRWRTERPSRGSWTSPVLIHVNEPGNADAWELIVNGTGGESGSAGSVIAYDPSSGAEKWRVRGTTDIPCPTAIAGNGLIVSSSGSNGPIFALRPERAGGELTEAQVAWRLPSGGAYVPTGVIFGEQLILLSDSGLVTCHHLDDGQIAWRKRLHGSFSASLVAGGGHVYAVSERGDVYVFQAGEQFSLVATNRMHEPCLATPALVAGKLLLRTERHLYCIAESTLAASDPADVRPAVDPASIRSPADAVELPQAVSTEPAQ